LNKRTVGTRFEEKAVVYLQNNQVIIREQNFRCRSGEIDIIGIHEGYLVFFEVKYRKNLRAGYPEEAVGIIKQQHICRVADYYRLVHKIAADFPIRYDVIAIAGEKTTWYRNAFNHTGNFW